MRAAARREARGRVTRLNLNARHGWNWSEMTLRPGRIRAALFPSTFLSPVEETCARGQGYVIRAIATSTRATSSSEDASARDRHKRFASLRKKHYVYYPSGTRSLECPLFALVIVRTRLLLLVFHVEIFILAPPPTNTSIFVIKITKSLRECLEVRKTTKIQIRNTKEILYKYYFKFVIWNRIFFL